MLGKFLSRYEDTAQIGQVISFSACKFPRGYRRYMVPEFIRFYWLKFITIAGNCAYTEIVAILSQNHVPIN